MLFPIASARRYPNILSAAGLNSAIAPSWSMLTMASRAASRMALLRTSLRRSDSSACLRSSMSCTSSTPSRGRPAASNSQVAVVYPHTTVPSLRT